MLPILLALSFIVLLLVVIIAGRPDAFTIARSTKVSVPPDKVFPLVNDFHQWNAWSPWAKMDPNCQNTFSGASVGTGAVFVWSGNKKVGEGRMTILESRPSNYVRIKLEFVRPFKATNFVEITFNPEGGQTLVTWSMSGKNNFMAKAVSMFMNCEKMVGGDFEKGLANIKSLTEANAAR